MPLLGNAFLDGEIPHGRELFVLSLYICLCPHGRGVLDPMVGMKFHLQKAR